VPENTRNAISDIGLEMISMENDDFVIEYEYPPPSNEETKDRVWFEYWTGDNANQALVMLGKCKGHMGTARLTWRSDES
jgi:hypothetical protein